VEKKCCYVADVEKKKRKSCPWPDLERRKKLGQMCINRGLADLTLATPTIKSN